MVKKPTLDHGYPLVTVRWYDHWCTEPNDTFTVEEVKEMARRVIRESSGYLVHEDRFVVGIAGTIEEDGTMCEINWFMKRAILSRSDS